MLDYSRPWHDLGWYQSAARWISHREVDIPSPPCSTRLHPKLCIAILVVSPLRSLITISRVETLLLRIGNFTSHILTLTNIRAIFEREAIQRTLLDCLNHPNDTRADILRNRLVVTSIAGYASTYDVHLAPRVYPSRSVNLWNEPTTFICAPRSLRFHPWKPECVKQQDGHDGITQGIL